MVGAFSGAVDCKRTPNEAHEKNRPRAIGLLLPMRPLPLSADSRELSYCCKINKLTSPSVARTASGRTFQSVSLLLP